MLVELEHSEDRSRPFLLLSCLVVLDEQDDGTETIIEKARGGESRDTRPYYLLQWEGDTLKLVARK